MVDTPELHYMAGKIADRCISFQHRDRLYAWLVSEPALFEERAAAVEAAFALGAAPANYPDARLGQVLILLAAQGG